MFFGLICFFCIVVGAIYILGKNGDFKREDDSLLTDMECYIAQLQIKPKKNRKIKEISKYLEDVVMPNEEILAVAYTNIYTIVTDKRVIIKGDKSNYVTIIPMEKISSVRQNGSTIYMNQNWVNLLSIDVATQMVNLINNQISNSQTIDKVIKIENKIVSEETITSQLKKLSDLHDAKILTDYEYSIKKQELLDKMK